MLRATLQVDDRMQQRFAKVRSASRRLVENLSDGDTTAQSMPDASPAKWHLAHTTWFFESFVLSDFVSHYRPFSARSSVLFNSYYEAKGTRIARSARGTITRPSLQEILEYRAICGPILGGYISDNYAWGWIFLINVTVGIFSLKCNSVRYARLKWTLAWMVTLATVSYGGARAEESPEGLLGDWGGLRTFFVDRGVDLELTYINEVASNVRGGASQETEDAEQVYFGGSLDLQRIFAVPGAKLIFSLTDRNGQSLSVKAELNTLLEVQEIYGEGDYVRLNQLYWEQHLFDDRLELKLGRLTGTFDFMPFSCKFQNISFCATLPSHNVVAQWIAFPGSTWAGVARVNFKRDWYVQAGVYEINPDFAEYKYRFAFGTPFGGLGKRVVAEVGWLPKSAGPDGGYRFGAWYDNVGGNDLYFNTARQPLVANGGTPLERHQESGFYAMAQQRVWAQRDSGTRGLSLFVNLVQTDRNITRIGQIAEIGLFWTGPLPARPQDDLGVAVGRVSVNRKVTESELLYNAQVAPLLNLPPEPVQRAEYPMEIYYNVNITPAITLRPNIQFIHAPGGVDDRANVLVLGTHLFVNF